MWTGESWALKDVKGQPFREGDREGRAKQLKGSDLRGRPFVGSGIRRLLRSGGIAVFPLALSSGA